jgi:hypothetical protein
MVKKSDEWSGLKDECSGGWDEWSTSGTNGQQVGRMVKKSDEWAGLKDEWSKLKDEWAEPPAGSQGA